MLTIILISCNAPGDLSSLCFSKIQYHTSSNCDDSPKTAIPISFNPTEANSLIADIEDALIGAETGECFLLSLTGFKDETSNENLGDVFLVNDINKSWLVKDCRNP